MVSSAAQSVEQYLAELAQPRKSEIESLLEVIRQALPAGYDECIRWGMISFEVPIEVSGPTYNKQPLNYVALASQKNYISIYLLGIYSLPDGEMQFRSRWESSGKKLNMGKACVRVKNSAEVDLETLRWAVGLSSPLEYVAQATAARSTRG